jgi:hypothetical protein
MTKEDIIRMARECGIPSDELYHPNLERFAALVAAAQCEACAKVCEELAEEEWADNERCAAAIRAIGKSFT